MCKLIVGEPFAGPIPRGRETAFLKLNEGGGFTIYAFLTEMTVGEAKNIRQAPMQFKVIQEDGFVHTLVRFGPIAYELPFNPNHYSRDSLQDLLNGTPEPRFNIVAIILTRLLLLCIIK